MKAALRVFRALLGLYPAPFRRRHGADMEDAFLAGFEERAAVGRMALAAFLVRTGWDLFRSAVQERLAPGRPRSRAPGSRGGLAVSWLDVKLGLRMLRKHPGLTLVSTFALAVGIPVGLAPGHFVDGLMAPLPVPEGERIRTLRLWSPAEGRAVATTHRDFERWRDGLRSFEELGAFRETVHNVDAGARGGPVRGAEVSASTFDLLGVRPVVGRPFGAPDAASGAEPVVVLGHDLWQARFDGDPSIVGRVVRLGSLPHTVVGVMPPGFHFPERQDVWTPLRPAPGDSLAAATPVSVFGRLAEGVEDHAARAEFTVVGARPPAPGASVDATLRPQVEAFAYTLLPGLGAGLGATPEFLAFQALALMVLLVACANVGMLVFARTRARTGEIAVRTALGASRARIAVQVFTECLVLAVLAAGAGLALMALTLRLLWAAVPARLAAALPYWIDWSIDGRTVVMALVLAVASAALAGVVPALRVTGSSVQATLQRTRTRRAGNRFGGVSGVLIVLDVAVAVAAVGFAATAYGQARGVDGSLETIGIPSEQFLAATLRTDAPTDAPADAEANRARTALVHEEILRRLRADPRVRTVAVADALPRMQHRTVLAEAEGVAPPEGRSGVSTRRARVAVDYFRSLDQPILAGRDFDVGDVSGEPSVVIVNSTFVEQVLGGQNAVGRRIRIHPWGDGEPGPWKEIVGVVGHLGMRMVSAESDQGVYEPAAPGALASASLGIRVVGDPEDFAPHLRAVVGAVDPGAIVSIVGPLDDVYEGDWYIVLMASLGGALLVGVLLTLAASGIYAIMSFAVAERTREIGIRAALGAGQVDLVRSVATRAAAQLGVGVILGMPVAGLFFASGRGTPVAGTLQTLVAGTAVMILVGVVACTGPTLRALRIAPRDALAGDD
ncbi:MAG: ABC transporter permease [Longimicrobiales bacterium]